ncbi:MAG: hypothetical protein II328_05420, partial [Clostridia bacterium]|nr:hypothetical protein [Clostridia bacterium]
QEEAGEEKEGGCALLASAVLTPAEAAKSPRSSAVAPVARAPKKPPVQKLYLRFSQKEDKIEQSALQILSGAKGSCEVFFFYEDEKRLCKADNLSVRPTPVLLRALTELLGEANVQLVEK